MSSLITLITDFGTADGYVGAMKGRILDMNPQADVVDITHDIKPQAIRQAAWCLKRAAATFPKDTVHVAVIDPGVGSSRDAVLFKSADQWFVGPDNGVFSEIILAGGIQQGYRLHDETKWWQKHASFDGLAIFVPAATCLTLGIDPLEMGRSASDFLVLETPQPLFEKNRLVGEIIMFDRFGNAITNLRRKDLERLERRPGTVCVGDIRLTLVGHYQEGEESTGVAVINSDGLVELSVFQGSARERFGLNNGEPVEIE